MTSELIAAQNPGVRNQQSPSKELVKRLETVGPVLRNQKSPNPEPNEEWASGCYGYISSAEGRDRRLSAKSS